MLRPLEFVHLTFRRGVAKSGLSVWSVTTYGRPYFRSSLIQCRISQCRNCRDKACLVSGRINPNRRTIFPTSASRNVSFPPAKQETGQALSLQYEPKCFISACVAQTARALYTRPIAQPRDEFLSFNFGIRVDAALRQKDRKAASFYADREYICESQQRLGMKTSG